MLDVEKIEERRQKLGLSQDDAAKKAGLSGKQQWHNIVKAGKNNVTLETLKRIAEALGVKPKDLLK